MKSFFTILNRALSAPHTPQPEGEILKTLIAWLESLLYPGRHRRIPSLKPGSGMCWGWAMVPQTLVMPMPDGVIVATQLVPMRVIVTAKGVAWGQPPLRRHLRGVPDSRN